MALFPLFPRELDPSEVDDPRARELRKCARCGKDSVRCTGVTRRTFVTLYHHRCTECRRRFKTETQGAIVSAAIWGPLFVIAAIFLAVKTGGSGHGIWVKAAALTTLVGMGVWTGIRTYRRHLELTKNPVVVQEQKREAAPKRFSSGKRKKRR